MTEALSNGLTSPGSLTEFALSCGHDSLGGSALVEYQVALAQYRKDLARVGGVTLEQLHHEPLVEMGKLVTDAFVTDTPKVEAAS